MGYTHLLFFLAPLCAQAFNTLRLASVDMPVASTYSLNMKSSSLMDSNLKKILGVSILSAALSFEPLILSPVVAADAPVSKNTLESAIVKLEQSEGREATVQSMADLFEAAGSKTLLARTKYKYRIINSINTQREKIGNDWDQALRFESGELKRRVDPFRTVDLKSYLKIAPIVGGVCYLGALFVQQTIPELFVLAYPAAVLLFVSPILFTVVFS
mmetsp:Transcript_14615/g.24197  ORF Transcript_14615/g.24197 Transcript_14615/m.24197 type:complete len:215 (+) Transcript_14615:52-696(+)